MIQLNIEAEQNNVGGVKVTTLSGKPGIGKTERTRKLAKEMGLSFYHVSAPEVSIEQLTGLPEFTDVEPGFEKYSVSNNNFQKSTSWSCPEIIANANIKAKEGKKGCLLLLDDIHETPLSTIPYFYQLLNEKKVSGWTLDEEVYIVTAMNDSDSANFAGLPSPIINRMSILKVDFDEKEFLDKYSVNFNYLVRSFLKANPIFLSETENTEAPFGSPRSWTQANNTFNYIYEQDKEFAIENVEDFFRGSISEKAAKELKKRVVYLEKLNLQNYVNQGVKEVMADKEITLDISEKEQIDQVLMGYIVNFIDTIEDSIYFTKLLEKNIDNRSFIGFCAAEVYLKYCAHLDEGQPISDGLRLFIEKGLEVGEFDFNNYKEMTPTQKKIVKNYKISERENFLNSIIPYMNAD